jgi:GDP/UDP-N,N'-diacetylbacillosamine 2-epimerase (hydrolysing)
MTIHPETVDYVQNNEFIEELKLTIPELLTAHQLVVTLPNADTFGSLFRVFFDEVKQLYPEKVYLIENFGIQSYFACMKYADLLIGNTSSGIIEAASFGKFVINLGNRQGGRVCSENVVTVPFDHLMILKEFINFKGKIYTGSNCYYQKNPASKILHRLKKELK